MPSSDQANQKSQPCFARASRGGGRPCCDRARGAGSDGSPIDRASNRPSPRFVPAGDACPSIFDPAKSPTPLPGRALHKYDNRVVPYRLQQGATGIGTSRASALRESGEVRPFLTSSVRVKVTAARSAMLPLGTLTRRFAQNNTENAGPGCRQVNFASVDFLFEHSSIRQGSHDFNWGVA
jgi:hypothetical protein